VVVASGCRASKIVRSLQASQPDLHIVGVFTEDIPEIWETDLPSILGDFSALPQLRASLAGYAIVALPHIQHVTARKVFEEYCHSFQRVVFIPDHLGTSCLEVSTREMRGDLGLEIKQRNHRVLSIFLKRAFDIVFSLMLIVLFAPMWIGLIFLVRQCSSGSIFFAHTRHGRNGKTFPALKFRTMVSNADEVLKRYLEQNPSELREWLDTHKLRTDPRVTSIGKFLRRYSIDELPQLVNVLKGEMSIVGPRPIVRAEIQRYGSGYELYKKMPPGLTGLWQISGRSNTSYAQRVAFDEYYVRNWSLWMDLYILSCTVRAVFSAEGAY
jgi:Undecaprenyl-phosphate galactose phosphotransferase WbaP